MERERLLDFCPLNAPRLLAIACIGFGMVLIISLVASAFWEHRQARFQNAPKLVSALQAFSREQLARGRALPAEISLNDLVRGGYLTTNDARAFEGMDVTFYTQAIDTSPQMILARARTADGQFICLLANGSIQQFSPSRYSELLRNSHLMPTNSQAKPPDRAP